MNTLTRVTCCRVDGAGWSVFVVTGTGVNRIMKRAPGFENVDNMTMIEANKAADDYRRTLQSQ